MVSTNDLGASSGITFRADDEPAENDALFLGLENMDGRCTTIQSAEKRGRNAVRPDYSISLAAKHMAGKSSLDEQMDRLVLPKNKVLDILFTGCDSHSAPAFLDKFSRVERESQNIKCHLRIGSRCIFCT